MSVTLTKEQRDAIAAEGRILVSASAGSGKTFVMIERLVSLIESGKTDVKHILCITFTKKAAAQMRDKLRVALIKRISSETDKPLRDRLKTQLADLPLADISTIHAFCGRLLQSRFYEVGIDPAFRIIAAGDALDSALSERALDEVLEKAFEEGNEEFKELLAVWFNRRRNGTLRELIRKLHEKTQGVGHKDGTSAALMEIGQVDLFPEACERIAQDYKRKAQYCIGAADEIFVSFKGENMSKNAPAQAQNVARAVSENAKQLLAAGGLFEMAKCVAADIPNMPAMTKATGDDLAALQRLSFSSQTIKSIYANLAKMKSYEEEYARAENARRRAACLARLTAKYDEAYTRLKREKGVLTYDDLETYALSVLAKEEVCAELREKYRYIFVDEYQDVNPVQEAIVSAVSGEQVFLVGDGKQAIYCFRGSRSEAFGEKAKTMNTLLPLTSNFRSAQKVLDCVNSVFLPVIDGYANMRGGGRYGKFEGEVCFHNTVKERGNKEERGVYSVMKGKLREDVNPEADEIVRIIESERGKLFYDVDKENEAERIRPVEWGDIAVLTRTNSGVADAIVRRCIERAIPVTTSAKTDICKFFEARLVIDWLSLLDNARQDIPLGTAMLSDIGGFTNEELATVRTYTPEGCYSFREACLRYGFDKAQPFDGALKEKIADFFERLEALRKAASMHTAAETVDILMAKGLEMQIARKGNVRVRLSHIRVLQEEAGEDSVHEFLFRLKALDYEIKRAESGGENAVKVYTMHASKGLEFPVVILADLGMSFHVLERKDFMWSDEMRFTPKSYDLEKRTASENLLRDCSRLCEEKKSVGAEMNLLYVAMTRAKYRLHLVFAPTKDFRPSEFAGRFSDFIELDKFKGLFEEESTLTPAQKRHASVTDADDKLKKEILNSMKNEYPHAAETALRVKSSATDILRGEEEEKNFDDFTGKGFTKEEGTAYHAFLQHVRFGAPAGSEVARMVAAGELSDEQAALLKIEKLEKILSMPALACLKDKKIWREQTFLLSLPAREMDLAESNDEVVFQGAIDLLIEDESGFTVVDYKFSGRSDESIAKKYAVQIKLYKKAVARTMRVKEETIKARIINIALGREIVV